MAPARDSLEVWQAAIKLVNALGNDDSSIDPNSSERMSNAITSAIHALPESNVKTWSMLTKHQVGLLDLCQICSSTSVPCPEFLILSASCTASYWQ